jgi:hypothetical protein
MKMTNEEAFKKAKSFMESYAISRNMLKMSRARLDGSALKLGSLKDRYDSEIEESFSDENDECFWRSKMFAVRRFVMGVDIACFKQLLFYHYIKGETVERCAELMGISRRSAFRIKKRALEHVAEQKFKNVKISV